MLDFDFSVEHVLMFMIVIFLLYHLVNNCGCMKDGFSVGGKACSGDWSGCKKDECNVWKQELIDSNMNNLAPGGQPSHYFCYENNGNWIASSVEAWVGYKNIANKKQICINCITDLNKVKCKNIGC